MARIARAVLLFQRPDLQPSEMFAQGVTDQRGAI
jgi:hypothetical protein